MFDPAYEMAEQARWDHQRDLEKIREAEDEVLRLTRIGAAPTIIREAKMKVDFWKNVESLDRATVVNGGLSV